MVQVICIVDFILFYLFEWEIHPDIKLVWIEPAQFIDKQVSDSLSKDLGMQMLSFPICFMGWGLRWDSVLGAID